MQEEVRKVNLCFIYENGSTEEITCEIDEFNKKHANKLKNKSIVAYIKEFVDTNNIFFFIKNSMGEPLDIFRLKEFGYYEQRRWKYSKVSKETLNSYINYMATVNKDPGSRKFILKKISMEIKG